VRGRVERIVHALNGPGPRKDPAEYLAGIFDVVIFEFVEAAGVKFKGPEKSTPREALAEDPA